MKKQKIFASLLGVMVLSTSLVGTVEAERGVMREGGFVTSSTELAKLDRKMKQACQMELGAVMTKAAEFKGKIEDAIEVDYEKRIKNFKNNIGRSLQGCIEQLKGITGGMSLEVPTLSSILDQLEQKITNTLDQACRKAVDRVNSKIGEALGKVNLDYTKDINVGGISVGKVGVGANLDQK